MILDPTTVKAIAVFAPATAAFFVGIAITPLITNLLYEHKMWKKESGKVDMQGNETPVYNKLYEDRDVGTPRMGGSVIWFAVLVTTALFVAATYMDGSASETINFLSREQTWLPLFTLTVGAAVGLVDDWLEVSGGSDYVPGGLSLKKRLAVVGGMGAIGGWWFYSKLGISSVFVPFVGSIGIGWWFIPFFILVMMATYSGGVIDGLDGLAGGVFAACFSAYGIIAFATGLIDLAALCFVIVGGILAFLWFNIPPARFFMAETGTMALTTTLAVIAFLTNQVLVLPIIAFPLVATTASSLIQVTSKRLRGKKVFIAAPLHHHLEALGWSETKVTMRYWVVSIICAMGGTVIALLSL